MNIEFEWDERKNLANFEKHGVWFAEAQTIWADRSASEYFDHLHSTVEDRFIRIGRSTGGNVLLVVFCERDNGQTIRIISARSLTLSEQKNYEERI